MKDEDRTIDGQPEEEEEPAFGNQENADPVLGVWVNSGFGKGSYACVIQSDRTMTLPDGLVQELGINAGDDLELELNEEEGVIYVRVVHHPWEVPDFMDPNEEQD